MITLSQVITLSSISVLPVEWVGFIWPGGRFILKKFQDWVREKALYGFHSAVQIIEETIGEYSR